MKEGKRDWALLFTAFLVGLLMVLCILTSGCHTIHGVGQDLQDMTKDYVE